MDGGMSGWLDRVIGRGMCRGLDGRMEGCSGGLRTGSHLKSSDFATFAGRNGLIDVLTEGWMNWRTSKWVNG